MESKDLEQTNPTQADSQKRTVFWETISIRAEDEKVVHVVNGQSRREYPVDHPDYDLVKKKVMDKYPELAPGKICTILRYSDGSEKVETKTLTP